MAGSADGRDSSPRRYCSNAFCLAAERDVVSTLTSTFVFEFCHLILMSES